ncbi:MAG: hypothetical protein GY850_19940 [bacterium]|nr:hypothetical protein [bacterium]
MAKTIWGNINADRTVAGGSGDFQVDEDTSKGCYTVIFDQNSFGDVPAVSVSVRENEGTKPDHVLGIELTKIADSQFSVIIRSTYSQNAYDKPFSFVAVGPPND